MGPGHTGGNVALGCRQLGLNVKFLDYIGDDWTGGQVRERLAKGGVDFEALISPGGATRRRAVNLVEKDGPPDCPFYDGPGIRTICGLPRGLLSSSFSRRARHVHLSITNFARFLFDDHSRRSGCPVYDRSAPTGDGLDDHHKDFAFRSDLVFSQPRAGGGASGSPR